VAVLAGSSHGRGTARVWVGREETRLNEDMWQTRRGAGADPTDAVYAWIYNTIVLQRARASVAYAYANTRGHKGV
jgi:hypothetical protein